MFFRSAIVSSLAAAVTASMGANTMITPQNDFNIPADSKIGRKLLMKARLVEQDETDGSWLDPRRVEQNQNDGSWLAGFSLRYDSCASLVQLRAEGNNKNDEGLLYTQNLVKFTACPGSSDGCSGCGSGAATYVVNMMDFIDAYTELKLAEQEYACEMIREYCYCENANDDQVCENNCYSDAGMDVCIEYEGGDDFEIQRYLECAEMEGGNGNNNNNNNNNQNYNQNSNSGGIDMYRSYWIGPMCSEKDGKSINMRVFYDAGCTSPAPTGVYEAFHYNSPLPYESSPIVTVGDCLSCIKVDQNANNNNNNNNNNQNQNQEVSELCAQSYEAAIKCESSLSSHLGQYYYTDTTGCEFIDNILPRLEKASRKVSSSSSASAGGGNAAATAFSVIFALTSVILGAYAFFLYRKIHRAKVNLSQAEMGIA